MYCKSCLFPSSNPMIKIILYKLPPLSPSSPHALLHYEKSHLRAGSRNLEHTIRPTRTREQDILREFYPQLPKSTFGCSLFLGWLSSFNLCFPLRFSSSKSHCFCLLESQSFESFLLCCLSCCFFCRCDTVYQSISRGDMEEEEK